MAIDKSIDYVAQDGVKNYIKNSQSVTAPKEFKARKNAPATKLAYITAEEAKMLKKMKKGTPHKGPKGIPSYDSFDADGNFTSGAAMSAMETGSQSAADRKEVQASNYGGPQGFAPGAKTQAEQDLRSSIIAAGAGQRVNPGFFDSRNTVSPFELARARAFNPTAFRKSRGSGILSFIKSGGLLGNLVRGIGQRLGLGKRFNEPTYDMSQFNNLGLLTDRVNPVFDDGSNEDLLSLIGTGGITDVDLGNPTGDPRIVPEEQGLEGDGSFKISSSPLSLSDTELQNRINIANQFELPIDYSDSDLRARTIRAMTQPGVLATLGSNNIETVTAYDPYKEMYSSSPNNLSSDVSPEFKNMITQVGMNETQKKKIDSAANMYSKVNPGEKLDATTQKEIFDNVKKFDTEAKEGLFGTSVGAEEADPLTEQEYKDYLISQGYI
jgi:hypothetical protein